MTDALKNMSGEKLLLLRIVYGEAVHADVDKELDRRTEVEQFRRINLEAFRKGRTFRMARASRIAV